MVKIPRLRNILINVGVIVFFIFLAYAYMFPLLEGKELRMGDIDHHLGMSKELVDYRNETGEEAVWTNSMFGGMPGYMISVNYPNNVINFFAGLPRTWFSIASFIILYFIGFYVLLTSLKINRWVSVAGAVAFGLSSYFIIILSAGHASKANALAFLPIVIAGVLMVFRRKYLPGTILFTIGLSLELLSGHPQITYY